MITRRESSLFYVDVGGQLAVNVTALHAEASTEPALRGSAVCATQAQHGAARVGHLRGPASLSGVSDTAHPQRPHTPPRRAPRAALIGLAAALIALFATPATASALPARFATEGTAADQISAGPQGIAVDQENGDVYVADKGNARVDKFGPNGEFMLAFGWGVADGVSKELQTCTTTCFHGLEGSGAGQFGSLQGGSEVRDTGPEGIAVDNDPSSFSHGDVYVIDSENLRVQKFSPEGGFLTMFGNEVNSSTKADTCPAAEAASCQAGVEVEGAGPGQFEGLGGRGIAVDAEGIVYVGDRNRVQRFSEEGVVEGEVAFAGVGRIKNLAVDSAKDIYLNGELQVGVHTYDPLGSELGKPRDEAGFPAGLAITIGPADELLLNDLQENRHILGFNLEGEQIASFDAGEENASHGIAYSEFTKALYILAKGAVRIVTPPPPGPFVLLGSEAVGEIEPASAKLQATVNPEGAASECRFEYGTTTAYGQSTPVTALSAVNEVQSVAVTATGGGFALVFKAEATGEIPFDATSAEVQGALEAIPALGAGQVAVSGEAGGPWSIEFTGARAGEDVPELGAEAGALTGPEPGAAVATVTPGVSLFEDRPISAAITGLAPSTTYHFRAVCENAAKEAGAGEDRSFATLPPVSIDGTSASQVNATSARLEADLNPHGVQSEYRFEYDTTPYAEGEGPHGTTVPFPDGSAGAGKTDTTVANLIQGLTPSSTYHYRVIAHNTLGEVVGTDHSFTTQGAASVLPDGRAWELVSPPNKHGSPLEPITEEGGLIQAAAGGGAFAYVALGPVNEEPKGVRSPQDTQLLSRRGAGGWSTQDITTPREEIAGVAPGFPSEYQFFAEDLSAGIVEPQGETLLDPGNPANTERTPYRREADGEFVPLVNATNVPPGTKFGGTEFAGTVEFSAASPDLGHAIVISPQILSPGFKAGFEANGKENVYELSGGSFTLVSVLPGGEAAAEAGLTAGVGLTNPRGVISREGNRVVFGAKALYLRDIARGQTLRLDALQAEAAGGTGLPEFQAANEDDSRIFFTDASRLTTDATAKPSEPDLYMCEVGESEGQLTCTLSDLSVDHNPGETANVQGEVSAIDASGSHVYFAANGVLTSTPNARGEVAVPGVCASGAEAATCNLYVYDTNTHQIGLVAVLASHDNPGWEGNNERGLAGLTARSSPDGHYFTFMSRRSLTGYDNRDAHSGAPDQEVFQFDSQTGKVSCVSCNPTGARPDGVFDKEAFPGLLVDHPRTWGGQWLAGSIPGWTLRSLKSSLYQSRYLSDSGREFFTSSDALVPQDTNNLNDVYQFEPPGVGDCTTEAKTYSATSGGCVALISSGSSKEESAFLDASQSGDEVFFLTGARLTGTDVDGSLDVYDAHVCTSSSPCPPPPATAAPACEGDSCQNPSPPPGEATPSSLSYRGPGNATPAPAVIVKPKAKPTRAQLLAKALKACKKDKRKHKRAVCERAARARYPVKSSHSSKRKR